MEIIAKCGNRCDLCPAYTKNIHKFGAETVSENWQKYLGFYLPPEKIECTGCHMEGYRPAGDCAIRACCTGRGFLHCDSCGEMVCEKLQRNIDAMEKLEKAQDTIPKEDYDNYFLPYQNKDVLLGLGSKSHKEENNMQIEMKEYPPRPVATIRTRTQLASLPQIIGQNYMEIMAYLESQKIQPADAPYTAYFNMDMQDMDVEMGFPVPEPIKGNEKIQQSSIPEGKYAVCMYKGSYNGMEAVYNQVFEWIGKQGFEPAGVYYEYYFNSPDEVPESELLTRIEMPVKIKA